MPEAPLQDSTPLDKATNSETASQAIQQEVSALEAALAAAEGIACDVLDQREARLQRTDAAA